MIQSNTRILFLCLLAVPGLWWTMSCASGPAAGRSESPSPVTGGEAPRPQARADHPAVDFSVTCLECHETMTPQVVGDWEEGSHGLVNVGCYICHGDGEVEFHAKPSSESCLSCHSRKAVDFESLPVDGCFGCHSGHRLTFHER